MTYAYVTALLCCCNTAWRDGGGVDGDLLISPQGRESWGLSWSQSGQQSHVTSCLTSGARLPAKVPLHSGTWAPGAAAGHSTEPPGRRASSGSRCWAAGVQREGRGDYGSTLKSGRMARGSGPSTVYALLNGTPLYRIRFRGPPFGSALQVQGSCQTPGSRRPRRGCRGDRVRGEAAGGARRAGLRVARASWERGCHVFRGKTTSARGAVSCEP